MIAEEAKTAFDELADQLAPVGVTSGAMFGKQALKANGKAFACLLDSTLAFRLDAGTPEHASALGLEGSELFDPSGRGRPFKDWVAVTSDNVGSWPNFAAAALAVVSA